MSHPNTDTSEQRIPNKHRKGWRGSSPATRTRKSRARASRPSRHPKRMVINTPAPGVRIQHNIADAWAGVGR